VSFGLGRDEMEGSLSQRERAGVREIANLPDGLTLFPRPPDF
jgi:hypothetical protein